MPVLKIQHSFQGASGIAKDQYVNTFHVVVGTVDSGSFDEMADDLKTFYNTPAAGATHEITWYMAGQADTPGARIKIYDLSDPIPRAPLFDETYTPSPAFGGTEQPLPSEVAVCLSYAGAPASGVPLARTKGRIYLGPLSTSAIDHSVAVDGISRPAAPMRSAMCNSAERLANDWADLDPVALWVVYSPTSETYRGIVRWWCDNSWDTQRRRGDAPTSRVTAEL